MPKLSIIAMVFLLPFCRCAELFRNHTKILFAREILLVNNTPNSIDIKIYDTLIPEPSFSHECDIGSAFLSPSFASIIPGGEGNIALNIENTLEYESETAIDTFSHLNSVYRQTAMQISNGNTTKLVLLPWYDEHWAISELPPDSNSTAEKVKIECSDTLYLRDLIN